MIAAGLLLCTDYLLVRLAAGSLQVTFRGLTRLGQAVAPDGEAGDAEDDAGEAEDDEEEEEEEEDEYEYEEEDECEEDESDEEEADEPSKRKSRRKAKRGGRRGVSVRFRGVSSTSGRDGDAAEAGTESDCEKTKGTAAGGAKGRLSLALRASKPKQNEHDDVIETLDAASRSDEQSDYELPSLELLLQAEEIPMVIAAPNLIPAGTRVDQALGTVDFAPTLLSLLGKETPAEAEGRDASPLLTGQANANWEDVAIIQSSGMKPSWFAVMNDRYKLVLSLSERPWLFDLQQDPDELKNSIELAENQDVVRKLAGNLRDYTQKQDSGFLNKKLDEQMQNLLR